jgi:hypothetical protein
LLEHPSPILVVAKWFTSTTNGAAFRIETKADENTTAVEAVPEVEGIIRRAVGMIGGMILIALEVGGLEMTATTAEIMENENFRVVGTGMRLFLDSTNKNIREDPAEAMMTKWRTVDGGCCPMPGKEKGLRCSYQKTWVCRGDLLISR